MFLELILRQFHLVYNRYCNCTFIHSYFLPKHTIHTVHLNFPRPPQNSKRTNKPFQTPETYAYTYTKYLYANSNTTIPLPDFPLYIHIRIYPWIVNSQSAKRRTNKQKPNRTLHNTHARKKKKKKKQWNTTERCSVRTSCTSNVPAKIPVLVYRGESHAYSRLETRSPVRSTATLYLKPMW